MACVWLYVRESIWSWPTGLVQVCLFAWVFLGVKLYSDFILHLIYIVLQIYGWEQWSRRRGAGEGDVSEIRRVTLGRAAAWGLSGWRSRGPTARR